MEHAINQLKKRYLNTPTPMTSDEGFVDLLGRIDTKNNTRSYFSGKFLALNLLLLLIAGGVCAFFLFAPVESIQTIKASAQKIIVNTLNLPNSSFEKPQTVIKKQLPTLTPTPTSTSTHKLNGPTKPTSSPPVQVPQDKKIEEPSSNNNSVKGTSVTGNSNRQNENSFTPEVKTHPNPGNQSDNSTSKREKEKK